MAEYQISRKYNVCDFIVYSLILTHNKMYKNLSTLTVFIQSNLTDSLRPIWNSVKDIISTSDPKPS